MLIPSSQKTNKDLHVDILMPKCYDRTLQCTVNNNILTFS